MYVKNLGISQLIDKGNEQKNTYLDPNGQIIENKNGFATMLNKIKIKPNETYYFKQDVSTSDFFRFNWYDKNEVMIARKASNLPSFAWTAPSNAYFLWVSYPMRSNPNISVPSDEFTLQATLTINNEVNGNQSLEGTIEYTKVNAFFIEDIDRLWSVYDHKDVGYKIQLLNRQGKGNKMVVTFKALPLFFDYMDTNSIMDSNDEHFRYDGSYTAFNAFTKIFEGTPFDFALVDSASSVEWENFAGGESKLETFKRALNRYEYEFEIRGSTVFLENQIGRDMSIQYRHKLNASNIQHELDASEQYTAIKGYGNFGETQSEDDAGSEDYRDARLKREYISPLADIIGLRYSPPFTDGRVKIASEMDRKLKYEVDNSLKLSVSADIVNLSKQGYPIDQSKVGDRVFLIDERINFNEEVRIVMQSITRNFKGDVIDANVTFGGEGLAHRYQSNINTAVKNITDIFDGKKEMPLSLLDKRVQEISAIINGNVDSVFKYMPNGVVGWNGDDPNYMTKYVGDAIGFSKDGGLTYNTAMSADLGIVADYITTGTLSAILIEGVEIYGSYFESRLDDNDYLNIEGAKLHSYGKFTRTWFGETTTHNVGFHVSRGYAYMENYNEDKRLYYSDKGISTFISGYDDESTNAENHGSGVIEFFSHQYNPTVRGLTLFSNRGEIALNANTRSIILDANVDVLIPHNNLRTDAVLTKIGSKNFYIGVSGELDGELRVTNKLLYNSGNTSYRDIAFANGRAQSIRSMGAGANFYIGVSTGELRVTNNLLYNGGNISWKDVAASGFNQVSSFTYKNNIKNYEGDALDIIDGLDVVSFNYKGEEEGKIGFISEYSEAIATKNYDAIDVAKVGTYNTKAIQELHAITKKQAEQITLLKEQLK